MPSMHPASHGLLVLLAVLACSGGAFALPSSPPPATRPQSAAANPLRRPTSWSEAWAVLVPYRLTPTTAAAPCGTGPTTAAACGVRRRVLAGVMPAVRSTTAASQLNRHLPCLVRAGGKHKVAMVAMEEQIQSAVQNNSSGKHGSCLRPSGWPQLGQKRQRRQQQSHSSLCLL